MTYAAERAADLLLRSRTEGALLSELPPDLAPATIDQAYAVQDATLRRIGPAGGWKVAPKPDSEPRCAVLPARAFHATGARLPVPAAGFEVEVETAFTFARDLPPRALPYTETEVAGAIGALHLAVELVSSRFRDRKGVPPLSPIADLQGNAAVVLGPAVTEWQGLDLGALPVTLALGGEALELPRRNTGAAATITVLAWLANHAAGRGEPLKRGDTVITGARLGPVPLGARADLHAACDGLGEVRVTFQR